MTRPSAAVVGAGLSGLTAAHRLAEAGWRVRVLECEPVIGGRVRSRREGGYLVDSGASALGAGYTGYLGLAEELGIRDRWCPRPPTSASTGRGGSTTCGWTG